VPRPLTDRGKGSYWTVNDNVDPRTGVHRIRKKKPKGAKRNSEEADVDYHPPDAAYDDGQFVQHPEDAGPSRAMGNFQHNGYDQPPNMPMMAMPGMPYPRPPPMVPYPTPKMALDEGIGLDEHGQINWRLAWLKELGHLQQVTAEQEKAQVEQEWYHMMLYRIRAAFGTPGPGEHMAGPPHGMLPPQPNPEDIQQQQQQQQQ
jgi:forkhead box protein J2/3